MDTIKQIKEIMKHLPHRYPFVMVDRVVELEPGHRIVTLKNVTINEPFFQGHFPGNPIMPGVLILEAMAQSAGVLTFESLPPEKRNILVYFMGIDRARFRRMVVPGDQLVIEIILKRLKTRAVKATGQARVDGELAVEAELMASIGEKE
ncbi:MAG: 3-hydroxyacyl-ACP dehydratase FabZ [Desulfobacteraceae bacterium]|jgi:beta-hydroxyacyl-ACP dehydratase FabZ|nr:3-hydroxyacyl-ACP dehydratase FabZ [Desulfobacteraceae bacterium]MBC2750502.1 3-hydroxyacyl-ACP dehydratase FabZ [Desulfobacteraceae bacterium]